VSDDGLMVSMTFRHRQKLRDDMARLKTERDEARMVAQQASELERYAQRERDALLARVAALVHAARLVIREHNCGDIEACAVCGPLEAALASEPGPTKEGK